MKKVKTLIISIFAGILFLSSGCYYDLTRQGLNYVNYTDLTQYDDCFFSSGDYGGDYESLSFIRVGKSAKVTEAMEPSRLSDVARTQSDDGGFYKFKTVSGRSYQIEKLHLSDVIELLYSEAKKQGANGVINVKYNIEYYSYKEHKNLPAVQTYYISSIYMTGWAIKTK